MKRRVLLLAVFLVFVPNCRAVQRVSGRSEAPPSSPLLRVDPEPPCLFMDDYCKDTKLYDI